MVQHNLAMEQQGEECKLADMAVEDKLVVGVLVEELLYWKVYSMAMEHFHPTYGVISKVIP